MNDEQISGAVYVQTNEPTNAVIAFRRSADGGLERAGTHETGGTGTGEPHLPSQGSVTLSGDGRHLLVTNAASGDVSVFAVDDDAGLELVGRSPAGASPRSVAEHDGLVYVLATGEPAVVGLRLGQGGLEPIAGGEIALPSADADPAQIGFAPHGSAVIVTDRAANAILLFPIGPDGSPGPPNELASSGPTPYGFACTAGGTLVVTEAFGAAKGAAAVSSYRLNGAHLAPATRSAGNGRSEICWAVATDDGRWAFTTNFADGAVSRYAIGSDGTVTLDDATAGLSVDGRPGLRDEALTAGGGYLYALDADSGSILGWAAGQEGTLSPVGSWAGLPATAAGLAAV
jgi:6-phosphogluconolactonase (cycloisomerase 2 family)